MPLTFANQVTIARILLVPFFILTVMSISSPDDYLRNVALILFLAAVISDVVDGYIARNHGQKTKAGAILDPLADKMLLIAAFICLHLKRSFFPQIYFPVWFVIGIISRDIILLIGAAIIQLNTGRLELEANKSGKLTAFLQVVCILGVLLQWPVTRFAWPFALGATLFSGVVYIKEGIRIINEHHASNH